MTVATHTFPLVTGIQAEVSALTGAEQRILSEQKSYAVNDRSYAMLSSLLKRVGDTDLTAMKEEERLEFIKAMLACDRKKCIVEARQFTNDFDEYFDFEYEYISTDATKGTQTSTQTVKIGKEFPTYQVRDFDASMLKECKNIREIEAVLKELKPKVFNNYQEVLDSKLIVFPLLKTKIEVRLRMLDGTGEGIASAYKKEQRSSHTTLLMHNACYRADPTSSWISFQYGDLDKIPTPDLDLMRMVLKYVEGRVDTEVMFEHPEADNKPQGEKNVVVDLTTQLSFFFRAGAI